MRHILAVFIFLFCTSCPAGVSLDGIPVLCNYIGELKCNSNYSVFQFQEEVNIKKFEMGKMDTITLKGKKYENVFFAKVDKALIKTAYIPSDSLIKDKAYVLFSKDPMIRGSVKCTGYSNGLERQNITLVQ